MKKSIPVLFFISCAFVCLQSLNHPQLKKDGAAPGYTGSPGDGLKNCTACHGGVAVEVENWITSDIPAEGYVPGQTYTITAVNREAGATRFGFEISPQNAAGDYLGEMVVTDPVRTKLIADTAVENGPLKYITYTAEGVDGTDSAVWQFNWVAPAAGTGDVTFYGGFNSNYEGHKEDDKTYLAKYTVKEKGNSSVNALHRTLLAYSHFPNPASESLTVAFTLVKKEQVNIHLVDVKGRVVASLYEGEKPAGSFSLPLKLQDDLSPGQYVVEIKAGEMRYAEPLVIR